MKFYICEHCGNIVTFLQSSGVPVMCCGQKMTELVPDSTDAAQEKHVPVVTVEGSMVECQGGLRPPSHDPRALYPVGGPGDHRGLSNQIPGARSGPGGQIALAPGDRVKAAYAYCNLHGLWRA